MNVDIVRLFRRHMHEGTTTYPSFSKSTSELRRGLRTRALRAPSATCDKGRVEGERHGKIDIEKAVRKRREPLGSFWCDYIDAWAV